MESIQINSRLSKEHLEIAEIIYKKWKNELRYRTRHDWYQFVGGVWIKINVHDIISDIINDHNILFVKYMNLTNKNSEEKYSQKIKECLNIVNKLNNDSYRNLVIKECKKLFKYQKN